MSTYNESKQFVVFKLDNQLYGINIQSVQIIERVKSIMRVPKVPMWIKGVLNLRGEIIPVIDLRLFFNMGEKKYDENTRIIIVKVEEAVIGLVVDSVKEVVELSDDNVENVPSIQGKINSNSIQGIGKVESDEAVVTLLHLKYIIDEAFQVPE